MVGGMLKSDTPTDSDVEGERRMSFVSGTRGDSGSVGSSCEGTDTGLGMRSW